MYCPSCGTKAGEADSYCSKCGKSLTAQQETVLYSFGPWGTGICFSRPSFFTVIHKNDTKIVSTNQRLSGYSSFTNSLRFQMPYEAITNTEIFDYMLWRVLWIQYVEAEKMREVSIMCTMSNHEHIDRVNELVQARRRR